MLGVVFASLLNADAILFDNVTNTNTRATLLFLNEIVVTSVAISTLTVSLNNVFDAFLDFLIDLVIRV